MGDLTDISRYLWPDADQGRQPQYPAPLDQTFRPARAFHFAQNLMSPVPGSSQGTAALTGNKGFSLGVSGRGMLVNAGSGGFVTIPTDTVSNFTQLIVCFGAASCTVQDFWDDDNGKIGRAHV